ncbi:Uncharacterised protein [Salmonella enterica subsp. enterica serovar Bovismorbificans]|uniref:Uncharacterized protein n=1 Tax=Salmonella enterica subsp. enterica serovar Bovismorbificans TaxID=58097 RepID=A0A655CKY2_SALET|nr:Uncharacterised protein [Salmonella enterica subsp. enterica serovar Bovismorbificans]
MPLGPVENMAHHKGRQAYHNTKHRRGERNSVAPHTMALQEQGGYRAPH